jgi:hypothetical protein
MRWLTGALRREEEELYVLDSFCASVEVGDDLTGRKVSENLSKRRRRDRNIRNIIIIEAASLGVRIRCTVTAPRLRLNKAIVCH